MSKKKRLKKSKRANTDHIAHQVNVTGVGAHKNRKKYDRKRDKRKIEKSLTKGR